MRSESGEIGVGSTFHHVSTTAVERGPDGGGSDIVDDADIEMKGVAKLAAPIMNLVLEKIGSDNEGDMSQTVNRLPRKRRSLTSIC